MAFDLGFTADQTTIADLFNSFFSNESRPEAVSYTHLTLPTTPYV